MYRHTPCTTKDAWASLPFLDQIHIESQFPASVALHEIENALFVFLPPFSNWKYLNCKNQKGRSYRRRGLLRKKEKASSILLHCCGPRFFGLPTVSCNHHFAGYCRVHHSSNSVIHYCAKTQDNLIDLTVSPISLESTYFQSTKK